MLNRLKWATGMAGLLVLLMATVMPGYQASGLEVLTADEAARVAGGNASSCDGGTPGAGVYGCTGEGCTQLRNTVIKIDPGPDKQLIKKCEYERGGMTRTCGDQLRGTPKCDN